MQIMSNVTFPFANSSFFFQSRSPGKSVLIWSELSRCSSSNHQFDSVNQFYLDIWINSLTHFLAAKTTCVRTWNISKLITIQFSCTCLMIWIKVLLWFGNAVHLRNSIKSSSNRITTFNNCTTLVTNLDLSSLGTLEIWAVMEPFWARKE